MFFFLEINETTPRGETKVFNGIFWEYISTRWRRQVLRSTAWNCEVYSELAISADNWHLIGDFVSFLYRPNNIVITLFGFYCIVVFLTDFPRFSFSSNAGSRGIFGCASSAVSIRLFFFSWTHRSKVHRTHAADKKIYCKCIYTAVG